MSSKSALEPLPRRRPLSLAARLTAWYAGTSFLLIVASSTFLYWALFANLDREDDQYLADTVALLSKRLHDTAGDLPALTRELEQVWAFQVPQIQVRILDQDGQILLQTPDMGEDLPAEVFPPPVPTANSAGNATELESSSGKAYRLLAAKDVVGNKGEKIWTLQVAFERTGEENLLANYRRALGLVLGAALLLCTLGGYQIARHGLRPLANIIRTTGHIRSSTLNERLDLTGLPAELSALASTFNEMLDRLEESFQRLARFSADIAHELRTPVSNLRGEAEVALGRPRSAEEYREVLGSSLEECGRLSRLIDSMLFLARADSPTALITRDVIQIASELEALREFYGAPAVEAGIALTTHAAKDLVAHVDRTLFQRAVGNLLANALAHTPAGGTVTVTATSDGHTLSVEVADTGDGIPAEHLPHVFDPFYRADPARVSTSGRVGLGLAIVKSIARLHQGSVRIASEVGRGTRITLELPSASPTAIPATNPVANRHS